MNEDEIEQEILELLKSKGYTAGRSGINAFAKGVAMMISSEKVRSFRLGIIKDMQDAIDVIEAKVKVE